MNEPGPVTYDLFSPVDSRVAELATQWQELNEEGVHLSLPDLCADAPELLQAVLARIQAGAEHGATIPTAPGAESQFPFLAPPKAPGEIGRLGPYRVVRLLGAGGMGLVFHGEDEKLKRPIALKVLRPGYSNQPGAAQRFLREAQAMAQLEHDHIVAVHHVGEEGGVLYLAMPLLRGEILSQRLKHTQRLPPAAVLRLAKHLALGLSVAHQRGYLHRDIKPSNIWLEEGTDRAKLLDFGLAREVRATGSVTASGVLVGTPAFMAPEQARGQKIDGRADLFSMGCVLYQAATGQSPFLRPDVVKTLIAVEMETPRSVRELVPQLPAPLAALILQLMEKEPSRRPASAQEVVQLLEAMERDVSLISNAAAQGMASPRKIPEQFKSVSQASSQQARASHRGRVLLMSAVGLAAALVLVLFVGGMFQSAAPDLVQPRSRWQGFFHFQGSDYRGDVDVVITERTGEQFMGTYSTEGGAYVWAIAGDLRNEAIQWRFTRVIHEKEPKDVVAQASVAGQCRGKEMELVFSHAGNNMKANMKLLWQPPAKAARE